MADHIQSGRTLTSEDVLEIQKLIARRDQQIEFLYHRELEFSEAIENITKQVEFLNHRELELSQAMENVARSPSFRIGRAVTWPLRALRRLF